MGGLLGATAFAAYTGTFQSYLGFLARSGYNCVELRNFIGDEGTIDLGRLPTVRRLLDDAGSKRSLGGANWQTTVHAPVDRNLASPDRAERERAFAEAVKALRVARELGSLVVVVHGGLHPVQREGLAIARDQLSALAGRAADLGVTLALENAEVGEERIFRYPEVLAAVTELPLRFVIDIGHAYTLGLLLKDFLPVVAGRLAEVHLHDNDGVEDRHWPLGTGSVPVEATLALLSETGFSGVHTVEVKDTTGLAISAAYLRERGLTVGGPPAPGGEAVVDGIDGEEVR